MDKQATQHDYDAFISYSWADQEWVRDFADQLEAETIDGNPQSRKLRVFTDELEIEAGANIVLRLSEGIQRSRFFIPILSPEFLASESTAFEWTHVVAEDPANRKGKLIPILLRDVTTDGTGRITLTAPFRGLRYLDFRRASDFKRRYLELLGRIRGQRIPRRRNRAPMGMNTPAQVEYSPEIEADAPDRCTEILISNLLPVLSLPRYVYSCSVKARKPAEFYSTSDFRFPVLLKSGKIYTFTNLELHTGDLGVGDGDVSVGRESLSDWLASESGRRDLVQLLNRFFESHLRSVGVRREKERNRFFFQLMEDGSDRTYQVQGDAPRTVAAVKKAKEGEGRFYVHHSARVSFRLLGNAVYLEVEPGYLFTEDGLKPIKGVAQGKLSFQWAGRQTNADILRNTMFWIRVITRGAAALKIQTGGDSVVVGGMPATARTSVGIADDSVAVGSLLRQAERSLADIANDAEVVFEEEEDDRND